MPNFDGTGPHGEGPMTGRCQGLCIMRKLVVGDKTLINGFIGESGKWVELSFNDKVGTGDLMSGRDGREPLRFRTMIGGAAGYCISHAIRSYKMPIPVFGNLNAFYGRFLFTLPLHQTFVPYPCVRPIYFGDRGRGHGCCNGGSRFLLDFYGW